VIDDHPIVLQGFRQLLEPVGVKQILEAETLDAGFRLYRDHRPDVVILDLAMQKSELSGLSFIRRLRQRDTRTPILVFTMHSDPTIVSRALKIGATGYVLKDDRYDDVFEAFECVRRGKTYISSAMCSEDGSLKEQETTNPLRPLTMRELQTLELLAEGKPYRAIAEHLHVSCATVSTTCTLQARRVYAARVDADYDPISSRGEAERLQRVVVKVACRGDRLPWADSAWEMS
jgi:two-component system invasion response regulator UvrY